jgi:hypothetical protein
MPPEAVPKRSRPASLPGFAGPMDISLCFYMIRDMKIDKRRKNVE